MMKATKQQKKTDHKPRNLYTIFPWKCRHQNDYSEIISYVEASGKWEVVAHINPTAGASAEQVATYICNLINDSHSNRSLVQAAMDALRLCVEEADLTFASEQDADQVLRRADQVFKISNYSKNKQHE